MPVLLSAVPPVSLDRGDRQRQINDSFTGSQSGVCVCVCYINQPFPPFFKLSLIPSCYHIKGVKGFISCFSQQFMSLGIHVGGR